MLKHVYEIHKHNYLILKCTLYISFDCKYINPIENADLYFKIYS